MADGAIPVKAVPCWRCFPQRGTGARDCWATRLHTRPASSHCPAWRHLCHGPAAAPRWR